MLVNDVLRTSTDSAGRFELDYMSRRVPAVRVAARGFGPAGLGPGPGNEVAERARRIALERAGSLVIALQVPAGTGRPRASRCAPRGYEISQDQTFSAAVHPLGAQVGSERGRRLVCTFEELPPSVRFVADVSGLGRLRSSAPRSRSCSRPARKKHSNGTCAAASSSATSTRRTARRRRESRSGSCGAEGGFRSTSFVSRRTTTSGAPRARDDGSFRFGGGRARHVGPCSGAGQLRPTATRPPTRSPRSPLEVTIPLRRAALARGRAHRPRALHPRHARRPGRNDGRAWCDLRHLGRG